jgi:hypothetical protein
VFKDFLYLFFSSIIFLGSQEFSVDPVDRYVPPDFVTVQDFFSSNPVKHSLDGAFAARLVRAL